MSLYTSGLAGGIISNSPPEKTFSKWKWFFIPWPVRSINNKIIFGPMYMKLEHDFIRQANIINAWDTDVTKHYATKKELFEARLKGTA